VKNIILTGENQTFKQKNMRLCLIEPIRNMPKVGLVSKIRKGFLRLKQRKIRIRYLYIEEHLSLLFFRHFKTIFVEKEMFFFVESRRFGKRRLTR